MDLRWGNFLLGVLITPLLVLITLIVGFLRPDYNHLHQSFSSLGLLYAPYWLVFNLVAFVLVGLLSFVYFHKLENELKFNGKNTSGIKSLQLASIAWTLTGVFPLSYDIRWLYWIHVIWALSAYIFGGFGMLRIGSSMVQDNNNAFLGFLTVLMGGGVWVSILIDQSDYLGSLMQLISILLYFSWLEVYTIYFYIHNIN